MDDNYLEKIYQTIDLDKLLLGLKICPFNFTRYMGNFGAIPESDPKARKAFIINNCIHDDKEELNQFIHVLLHTGHDETAFLLAKKSPNLNPMIIQLIDLSRGDPSKYQINVNPVDILKDKPDDYNMSRNPSNAYSMTNKPRGYCILINNYFTWGTYNEMLRFRNIFFQMQFKVKMKKNLDKKDILSTLRVLSQKDELEKHDAFILMIITHGNDNKEIYGFDGQPIRIDTITGMFNNAECKLMKHKPRIFFFNCCRGSMTDPGVSALATSIPPTINNPYTHISGIPTILDSIVCYSTPDGMLAYVDWNTGTKFGEALSDCLVRKASYKTLESILTEANGLLVKWTATDPIKKPCEWTSSGTRDLYLNPFVPNKVYFNT